MYCKFGVASSRDANENFDSTNQWNQTTTTMCCLFHRWCGGSVEKETSGVVWKEQITVSLLGMKYGGAKRCAVKKSSDRLIGDLGAGSEARRSINVGLQNKFTHIWIMGRPVTTQKFTFKQSLQKSIEMERAHVWLTCDVCVKRVASVNKSSLSI